MFKKLSFKILLLTMVTVFLSTSVIADSVTFQWDPNSPSSDGYKLFKREDASVYNYEQPAWEGVDTTATLNVTGPDGEKTKYLFVVRAYKDTAESPDSNEVEYVVDRVPPMAVSDLSASFNPSTSEITLEWTQPGTEAVEYWKVFYSTVADGPYEEFIDVENTNGTSLVVSKQIVVQPGEMKTFYFVVVGFKTDSVYSANSNEASVTIDMRPVAPINTLKITVTTKE